LNLKQCSCKNDHKSAIDVYIKAKIESEELEIVSPLDENEEEEERTSR
jgi:hypothetical protein